MNPQSMQSPLPSTNPPVLGSQVPGTTGGLPALGGLSVTNPNPMAQHLQGFGRGDDSMLVHMTPAEVNSLQGLAMATGGSLTTNPHTGLPEAGWLGKLLPTILGIAGAAVGIPTWAMGLGGTAVGTAVTGDLGKGLMAGLGAYGGAGLGNAMGIGGTLGHIGTDLGLTSAKEVAAETAKKAAEEAAKQAVTNVPAPTALAAPTRDAVAMGSRFGSAITPPPFAPGAAGSGLTSTVNAGNLGANLPKPGFMDAYKAATNIKGLGNIGAIAGGLGVLNNISEASAPKLPTYKEENPYSKYKGPYTPTPRQLIMPTTSARERKGAEHVFFDNVNPVPGFEDYNPNPGMSADTGLGMASGGSVPSRPTGERIFEFAPSTMPMGLPFNLQSSASMPGGLKGQMLAKMQAGNTPGSNYVAPNLANAKVAAAPYTPGRERDFGFRSLSADIPMAGSGMGSGAYQSYLGGAFNPMAGSGAAFAHGGEVPLSDGSFVLDARTVSEIGNGSSNAGKEILRAIGGQAIEGPGDGVSDSVPARIGRHQPARVARDEVIVPADAVRHIGHGSPKRGAAKLYALMKKAQAARKKASRGQDTKLRRGLV